VPYLDEDTVKLHLYKHGFCPDYFDRVNLEETYPDLKINTRGA